MSTRRYQYAYAVLDPNLDDMCIQVLDTTVDCSGYPNYILLDSYNEECLFKYYDRATGKWYLDAAHTTEWIPD